MRLAYKAFNADLTCTHGKGTFQYEQNKWYEEPEANCVKNGFHCAENPLDTMNYYGSWDDHQFWIVAIDGDIDEDGTDTKISATKIKLVRRLTLQEFLVHAVTYIYEHPSLPMNQRVKEDNTEMTENDKFVIVRNTDPWAKAVRIGQYIALIKDGPKGSNKIEAAGLFYVDGINTRTNVWIDVEGKEC
jgi:hypothetical protein